MYIYIHVCYIHRLSKVATCMLCTLCPYLYLRVYMCVCICIYTYICICVFIHLYIRIYYIHRLPKVATVMLCTLFSSSHMSIYVYICVCVYTHTYIYIFMYLNICIYIYITYAGCQRSPPSRCVRSYQGFSIYSYTPPHSRHQRRCSIQPINPRRCSLQIGSQRRLSRQLSGGYVSDADIRSGAGSSTCTQSAGQTAGT